VKRPIAGYVFAAMLVSMVFMALALVTYCHGRQP
jgi:hypothetical protein